MEFLRKGLFPSLITDLGHPFINQQALMNTLFLWCFFSIYLELQTGQVRKTVDNVLLQVDDLSWGEIEIWSFVFLVFSAVIGEWEQDKNRKQVPVYWDNARLEIMTPASSQEETFL